MKTKVPIKSRVYWLDEHNSPSYLFCFNMVLINLQRTFTVPISWHLHKYLSEAGEGRAAVGGPQSQITVHSDCGHAIKRHFHLERKAMPNLGSILKSRDSTLPTKVHVLKAMIFPVVMYRCESWIIKKAERRRTDAFKLWCWKRLLRVPWTARRSNQSLLKSWISIGRTDAEAPILWPPDAKSQFTGKDPEAGKDWKQEKGTTEDEMAGWHHRLNGHEFEQALGDGEGQGSLAVHGVAKSWTQLSDWTRVGPFTRQGNWIIRKARARSPKKENWA